MSENRKNDVYWKVLSAVLFVVLVGMVIVIVIDNQKPTYIYKESSRVQAQSDLASLSPSLQVDHSSIYWIADLAEKALPFVVNIRTEMEFPGNGNSGDQSRDSARDLFQDLEENLPRGFEDMFEYRFDEEGRDFPEDHPPMGGEGSGFIIREDGYIVTNAHVVEGISPSTGSPLDPNSVNMSYFVVLNDGTELEAELIGTDNFKDIAVLKVNMDNLPVATLGNSATTRIGEPMVAIGSPLGFDATVTAGILSTNKRSLTDLGHRDDIRRPQNYLQTDAAINQGNSGGPLLNASGEVVGVNQAIIRWEGQSSFSMPGAFVPVEGLGFAIPINDVKDTIEQIVTNGRVVYPGISAQIISVEDFLAGEPGVELDVDRGVFLQTVTIGGPADKAGINSGDVILSINGVDVNDGQSLIEEIQRHKVGDRVTLLVARQGGEKREEITVVLGELDISGIEIGR